MVNGRFMADAAQPAMEELNPELVKDFVETKTKVRFGI